MIRRHQVFTPVGRCIYCGSTAPPLGREHIIALALGGNHILPRASCAVCAKATSSDEQVVVREMFGSVRSKFDLRGHSRTKPAIDLNPVLTIRDGPSGKLLIDAAHLPTFAIGAQLPPPGIWSDAPLSNSNPPMDLHVWRASSPIGDWRNAVGRRIEGQVSLSFPVATLPWGPFNRMLAKIAHGYLQANFRPSTCNALINFLLPDLVLGRVDTYSHFIGGAEPRPAQPDLLHSLDFVLSRPDRNVSGFDGVTEVLEVEIGLFRFAGLPIYRVVVATSSHAHSLAEELHQGFTRQHVPRGQR